MKHNRTTEAGFTITEIIVVIVAFGILLPVIVNTIGMLRSLNDRARDIATINALIENKAESLRSVSFVGLTNGTTDFASELPPEISQPRSATYTISSVSPALKQVDIVVSYNDYGAQREMEFRTYIGELGVGQY